jgi:hypothetical protein
VHDGGKRAALAGPAHLHDFFKEVHGFLRFTLPRAGRGVNDSGEWRVASGEKKTEALFARVFF